MDIENRALDVVNSVVKSTDFTRTQNFFDWLFTTNILTAIFFLIFLSNLNKINNENSSLKLIFPHGNDHKHNELTMNNQAMSEENEFMLSQIWLLISTVHIRFSLIESYWKSLVFKNAHFLIENTQSRNFENLTTDFDSLYLTT